MKKATLFVGQPYQNNNIFDLKNKNLNRDDCLLAFYLLKQEFKKHGYSCNTQDITNINDADIVLYNDMPIKMPTKKEKSFLMIFESELIRPDNWDKKKHIFFNKIFTWNDKFVDNKKYYKFNFANKKILPPLDSFKERNLITLIAANKTNNNKNELYSKRLDAINNLQRICPEDFTFYGFGWNQYKLGILGKVLRKLKMSKILNNKTHRSYGGSIKSKNSILKKYKFAICYENAQNIDGYITEKIFDCFFAGCIPIYWGANNINDYIPPDCFINSNNFKNYEELYNFITKISQEQYNRYIESITHFLNSKKFEQFSNHFFATNIVNVISGDYD